MNTYPAELLNHHYACMLVSGLDPPAESPAHAAFPELCRDLVEIINARGRNTVWDSARGRAAVFHSVLVDHTVRLPPLKTRPNNTTLPARSPLSPLHPTSPLFPDGLIAPIWTRKHRELVPAVFVAFHCLAERPQGELTPEAGAELRKQDERLIELIAERKRGLTERGIKMTVVLLTTRQMLEDPALEARLSFIRRTSGLDSRASLFVLTPVSRQELNEFVTSLHGTLYESALDYYREHARRVKRKRARYPPPPSVIQPILTAAASLPGRTPNETLTPLSREGWIVRAEYKLGTFAELQGDNDEALSRYQEAYEILSGPCLGSTMMLPPRTKRWAEAKVLADTLSIKISKFHLYKDDGAAAMRQFQRHLHRFTELSTGWGIGNMTFEYWSWLCKQYRMFADLVEVATRSTAGSPLPPFNLPWHAPPLPSRLLHPDYLPRLNTMPAPLGMLTPNQAAIMSGVSPGALVQGAGTFYYLAALCTLERRDRFHKMMAAESSDDPTSNPALHNEQKVDYTAQITEQLTRAYESFKRARLQRLSLFVASRIALTYLEGEQHEMALRFLERIIRSYRRDRCDDIQSWLLALAAPCALEVKDVDSAAKILIDVLVLNVDLPTDQLDALTSLVMEKPPQILIEGEGLFRVDVVFVDATVQIGSPTSFQLRLTAPATSRGLGSITFDELELYLLGSDHTFKIRNADAGPETQQIVNLGELGKEDADKAEAQLRWEPGTCKVFQGTVVPEAEGLLQVTGATLRKGGLEVQLDFVVGSPLAGCMQDARWLLPSGKSVSVAQRERTDTTFVQSRNYRLRVSVEHDEFALLDEKFPLRIKVANEDSETVECIADLALQPAYEGVDDTLELENGTAMTHVREHVVGSIAPGEEETLVVYLKAARRAGPRVVDVVLRAGTSERTMTVNVAVGQAFRATLIRPLSSEAPTSKRRRALLDFSDSDSDGDDDEEEAGKARKPPGSVRIEAQIELVSDIALLVERVSLVVAEEHDELVGVWERGDRYIATLETIAESEQYLEVVWRRPDWAESAVTQLALPAISRPERQAPVTVRAELAGSGYLDEALDMSLVLTSHDEARTRHVVVALESSDNFVFAGPRRLTVGHLLPGEERRLDAAVRLVPTTMGRVELPRITAWLGEEEIRVETRSVLNVLVRAASASASASASAPGTG